MGMFDDENKSDFDLNAFDGLLEGTQVEQVKDFFDTATAAMDAQEVEQLAKDPEVELHGEKKLELAKEKVRDELAKYNFYFTDEQLKTFIEAAVHSMNSAWKGK